MPDLQMPRMNLGLVLFTFGSVIVLGALGRYYMDSPDVSMMLYAAAGAILVAATLMNPEVGLYIVAVAAMFSPEIPIIRPAVGPGLQQQRPVVIRVEDILLGVLMASWFLKTGIRKELGILVRTPLNRPLFVFLMANIMATLFGVILWTVRPFTAFFYILKYAEYYVIFFMVVNHITAEREIRRMLAITLLVCFATCLFGYYQIMAFPGERVSTPFEGDVGEPNTLGGYLVFMLGITMGMFLEAPSQTMRWLMGALSAFMLMPLAHTQSRSSYAAVVPMLLVLFLLTRRRIFMTVMLLGAILWVTIPPLRPGVVSRRIEYTFKQDPYEGQIQIGNTRIDTSASSRLKSWQWNLERLFARPTHTFIGFGVTGVPFLDAQYVRTLCETGIVGLVAFGWLLLTMFREARRVYLSVRDDFHRSVALGYMAGFVGLLVHAVGSNTFILVRIMEPFWFVTGLIVMMPIMEAQTEQEEAIIRPVRPSWAPAG